MVLAGVSIIVHFIGRVQNDAQSILNLIIYNVIGESVA